MKKSKSKQPDETYNNILNAATELFAEKGFVATSIADIAKKTKIATGSIYNRFRISPKSDIMLSITLRFWEGVNRSVEDSLTRSTETSSTGRLNIIFGVLKLTLYENKPALYLAKALHEPVPRFFTKKERGLLKKQHAIEEENNKFLTVVGNIIGEGQKTGEFKTLPLIAVRQMLYGTFEKLVFQLFLEQRKKEVSFTKDEVDETLHFLIDSIKCKT